MIKNKLKIGLILLSMVSSSAFAEPFSSWSSERDIQIDKNITVSKFEPKPLPYDYFQKEIFESNNSDLQMKIAMAFEKGMYGVPVDANQAAIWYNRAAINGSSDAAMKVYSYSKQIHKGNVDDIALDWLEFSADNGNANAINELAQYYTKGNIKTADKENLEKAKKLFEKADKMGYPNAGYEAKKIEKELKERNSRGMFSSFFSSFKFADDI